MHDEIKIWPTRKAHINSPDHHIVTFNNFVLLRVLGNGSSYDVVTATADEDNKSFLAADNQELLLELARKTSKALGCEPQERRDYYGRDYVLICGLNNDGEMWQVSLDRVIVVFNGFIREILNEPLQAKSEP